MTNESSTHAPCLRMQGVSKSFLVGGATHSVVQGFDLDVQPGEIVWLAGRSGSGKSTILRIAGLLSVPDSGSVQVDGEVASTSHQRDLIRARAIGVAFQDANLISNLTLEQNLTIASVAADRTRVHQLIDDFGLGQVRLQPSRLLSGGEAQRAALCRAVINRPSLLLADEPTSALDEANALTIMDTLSSIAAGGVGILIASHDPRIGSICSSTVFTERTSE